MPDLNVKSKRINDFLATRLQVTAQRPLLYGLQRTAIRESSSLIPTGQASSCDERNSLERYRRTRTVPLYELAGCTVSSERIGSRGADGHDPRIAAELRQLATLST